MLQILYFRDHNTKRNSVSISRPIVSQRWVPVTRFALLANQRPLLDPSSSPSLHLIAKLVQKHTILFKTQDYMDSTFDKSREGTFILCSEERNSEGSFFLSHTIMSISKARNPEREKIERYRKRKHTGRCWKYEWQGDFFSQKYFSRRLLIQEEELFLPECSKDQQFTWWTSTNKRVKFKSHCNCND